jgi:hypothetical protein
MVFTSVVTILNLYGLCLHGNNLADVIYFYTGTSPHPIPCATPSPGYSIKLSCDRHLLAAAHNNIRVGPVLAVLKVRVRGRSGLL